MNIPLAGNSFSPCRYLLVGYSWALVGLDMRSHPNQPLMEVIFHTLDVVVEDVQIQE